jgi:hypothetical protein
MLTAIQAEIAIIFVAGNARCSMASAVFGLLTRFFGVGGAVWAFGVPFWAACL